MPGWMSMILPKILLAENPVELIVEAFGACLNCSYCPLRLLAPIQDSLLFVLL